ncbi:GNAT family N-acetyltransferase [Sphingomonas humi]|uniref:GNAT family N-acetyltransferase n=1 Tax=Sphingomonas humi TaxID=335630 RepID=A0ABP7SE07_9SPHN
MSITIHQGELSQPDVQKLLALHVAAMHAHSPPEACHVLPGSAFAHPSITFFTAREDARLLGIGALKALGPEGGEIKSMRTAPTALKRGVGQALLEAIIAEARNRGYPALWLETGTGEDFAAATALYDRNGFSACGSFGDYPDSPFTCFLRLPL